MKFPKIPFWIIVTILVPLVYLLIINPAIFIYLFSSITSPGKGTVEKEMHRYLEDRYNKSFEMITFNRSNLQGRFEGRVRSVDDGIVFNVFQGPSGERQNDFLLKAWAKPLIDPFIQSTNIVYEVKFRQPPLSAETVNPDYRDRIFSEKPQDLYLTVYLLYTNRISSEQIYSIIKEFKNRHVKDVSIILYPMKNPPQLNEIIKQDILDFHADNAQKFLDTCVIDNYEEINAIEDVATISNCVTTE